MEAGQEVAIGGAKNVRAVKVSKELKVEGEGNIDKNGVQVNYEMPFGERVPLKLCTD